MALQRMRWSNTGAELIRTQARDGANLRSIDEPRSPRLGPVHIHLYGVKTADQAPTGGLPPARKEQNVEPEEAGFRDRGIQLSGRDQAGPPGNWSRSNLGAGRRRLCRGGAG